MSKQSIKRDKERYCNYLLNYKWTIKYSIFFNADSYEGEMIIDAIRQYKREILRRYSEQAFLFRLQLSKYNGHRRPILVFYTTKHIPKRESLKKKLEDLSGFDLVMMNEYVKRQKLERAAKTIYEYKPHDINTFLGLDRPNRFSVGNKKYLEEFIEEES